MIKLGVIGAGIIADEHLKVIKEIKSFKLISITSRTYDKSLKLAQRYKIQKIYTNIDQMLKNEKLDALVIFVSAENMYGVLKKIIKYRITFFFEKPAALNFKKSKELQILAKKYNIKNMIGLNRRFYSNFAEGKKFLKKRGGINGFLIEGHERFWRFEKFKNKDKYKNWTYANSIHTLDLLRFFGGEIKKINSFSNNNNIFKNKTISIKFKNNVIGTYITNWNSPGGWSVTLYGERYTVIFKPLEKGLIINDKFKIKKIKPKIIDIKYKSGFMEQMKCFKKLVLKKKLDYPGQDLNSYLKTLLILEKT